MKPLIANTFAVSATKDGKDAYILDLTNQMNSVPVDANGKVTFATTLTTVARIIKGADYVREDISLPDAATLKIGDVTPTVTNNTGLVTIQWKFLTSHVLTEERYVKTIALEHKGKRYTADYVARTDKSGAVYDLLPSLSEVSFSRNTNNSLSPSYRMLYCGYVKNQNGTVTSVAGKAQTEVYNIDGKYSIFYREVNTDGTFGAWKYVKDLSSSGFGIKVENSSALAGYQFALSSATDTALTDASIIDIETVPIVKDGKNASFLDIDNEMDVVQTDSTLKVSAARTIVTKARIYDGAALKTSDITKPTAASLAISYINNSGNTVNLTPTVSDPDANGVITISWEFTTAMKLTAKKYDITIVVKYGTTEYDAVFTLVASEGAVVHQLQPTLSVISFSRTSETDNTLTPENRTLGMNVLKIDGASTESLSVADSGMTVRYSTSSMPSSKTSGTAWPAAGLTVSRSATYKNVYIAMFNSAGTLLDRETVPVVVDGINGSSPYFADFDNEMDSVACDKEGKTTSEQYVETNVSFFKGNTKQTIKSSGGIVCKIASYELGDSYAAEGSPTPATTFKAVVTGLGTTSANIKVYVKSGTTITTPVKITITVKATIDGADKSANLTLTINGVRPGPDGTPATIYNLLPSLSEINVGRTDAGGYTPQYNTIKCGYKKVVGNDVTTISDATGNIDSKYRIFFRRRVRSTGAWETVFYWYNNTAYHRMVVITSGYDTSGHDAAYYDKLEFLLYKDTSSAYISESSLTDDNILDRETVPVVADGTKGGDGNGITSVTLYRRFTQGFEAPDDSDSGWIVEGSSNFPTEAGLSKENRYLWQLKKTTYRDTNPTYEVSLLCQYDSGICENLLEDTAFLSEGQMEAWEAKHGVIGLNTVGAHNSFGGEPVWTDNYTELLVQKVYRYGTIQKLKPNTWYTLSFVAGMANNSQLFSGSAYNGQDDTNYAYINNVKKSFYVGAGNTVKLTFKGYNASSSVKMICYLFCRYPSSDSWQISTSGEITGTGTKTITLTLTNTTGSDRLFECEVVVYNASTGSQNTNSSSSYRGYITEITIDRGARLATYLYRSDNGQAVLHSSSAPWYVDGKKVTAVTNLGDGESGNALRKGTIAGFADDGGVYWQLSPSHVRHSVTFKTPSSLASGVDYRVLFRFFNESNYGWVSMPKLEENTIATEWIEHTNDRMADDIQHIYVGKWSSGTTYYYGGGTGVRHVVRAKKSVSGNMTYFRMKQRTTSAGYVSETEPYNDSTHWEQADFLKFAAAEFLLADEAIINFAQTNRILVYNASGAVAAGMGGAEGGNTDYPLWVGANYANRANAPFRVTLAGKLYATEANIVGRIEGSVRNPFKLVYDSFSTYDKDNLAMMTEEGWGAKTSFSLSWDVNQSGRVIRLSSYAWNSNNFPTSGWGVIDAPTGKYFYENGRRFSHLYFSREMIELVGYGTDTTFYGWVVVKRVDFMTEKAYGMENRCIMMGRILGATTANGTTVTGKGYRFDGNAVDAPSVQLTRQDAGVYKLTIPTSWKLTEDSIQVQTSPIGYIKDGGNMLLNASVRSFEKSGGYISAIIFQLSDDDSTNDGDMYFAIYNMEQYLQWMAT